MSVCVIVWISEMSEFLVRVTVLMWSSYDPNPDPGRVTKLRQLRQPIRGSLRALQNVPGGTRVVLSKAPNLTTRDELRTTGSNHREVGHARISATNKLQTIQSTALISLNKPNRALICSNNSIRGPSLSLFVCCTP